MGADSQTGKQFEDRVGKCRSLLPESECDSVGRIKAYNSLLNAQRRLYVDTGHFCSDYVFMGVGRNCAFGGDCQFVFFPDDQANKRLFRSGRSRLFGCHLCDGVHLDCCTCFELASKIRGTSTSEDHVFIGSTAGSVARRAMLLSQVIDNRATRSLPRTKKILGQYSDLPTRKVPETLDPAQPQRTGIPMIRPGTGVGR